MVHLTGRKEGQGGGDRERKGQGVSPDSVPGFSHLNIHYWVGRDSLLPGLHEKTPGSTLFPLPSPGAFYFLCGIITLTRIKREKE